ncbi:hypothetical protein STTU_2608 [Streptomyces sp. Tu6071]|nr:hypothetical protein STTU_2608 [Streptomyces sp. Tu6071]
MTLRGRTNGSGAAPRTRLVGLRPHTQLLNLPQPSAGRCPQRG